MVPTWTGQVLVCGGKQVFYIHIYTRIQFFLPKVGDAFSIRGASSIRDFTVCSK